MIYHCLPGQWWKISYYNKRQQDQTWHIIDHSVLCYNVSMLDVRCWYTFSSFAPAEMSTAHFHTSPDARMPDTCVTIFSVCLSDIRRCWSVSVSEFESVSRGEDDEDQVIRGEGGGEKKCVGNVKLKFRRNNFQFRECSCVWQLTRYLLTSQL